MSYRYKSRLLSRLKTLVERVATYAETERAMDETATEEPRSPRRWSRLENRTFVDNPYTRVQMENGKVKVAVNNPYFQYNYADPYVQIDIGNPKADTPKKDS